MKVKNIYKMMAGAVVLAVASQGLVSCSDSWDDHYEMEGSNGTSSLLQLVKEDPQLSDFLSLLQATHVYNNNHRTRVTFADLLDADQTLTVWAPVNGTYNIDSLLELCQTAKGDSTVGQHFVMNHIAHNLYNMNGQTDENVRMLNEKFLALNSDAIYNASVVDAKHKNMPATNGLLHVVNDDAQYTYNIYEGLTSMAEFSHIGDFLAHYEKQKLNEEQSIELGIEDGLKVYSDSVMMKENALFRVFDQIMSEDSTFFMIVPNKETWETVYEASAKFFNYGSVEKADSISRYWTNISLIRDLIYNKNDQRSEQDSIFSTSYKSLYYPYATLEWPYHVYYRPYDAGGVMDPANINSDLMCSNGYIYRINEWPFTPEQLFFRPITTQGENRARLIDNKECTLNYRDAIGDTISGNAYVSIVPAKNTSNWTATFEIRNTLSGTYDICAVILPKTVYLSNSRDFKPNKFKATLFYMDENGEEQSVAFDEELMSDGRCVDTVKIATFTFPVCNYQQQDATVRLQLECSINSKKPAEVKAYSREMFLDCIYLKPVSDGGEEAAEEANKRKEAQK